jgi:hypothetical protein
MAAHFPPFDDDDAQIDADSKSVTYPPGDITGTGGEPPRGVILGASAPDPVNAPPHYRQGDIECIDAIRAALTDEEWRGYCKGNAIKYVWRERHKGGDESVAKAGWYLERMRRS